MRFGETPERNILNFQLLWSIVFYLLVFSFAFSKIMHLRYNNAIIILAVVIMYGLNIIIPVIAAVRINRGRGIELYPRISRLII